MKKLLIISILSYFNLYSQTESIKLKKENEISFFPSIAGYFDGEINYTLICDSEGIKCPNGFIIDQFSLSFGDQKIIIYDNKIPNSICAKLGSCCIGDILFFTNITAKNSLNETIFLSPFSLTLTKK